MVESMRSHSMTNEPNEVMQTTAYSLCFAAAFGGAGCPALTIYQHQRDYQETCVLTATLTISAF
jgi:hypothetical protein